MPDSPDGPGAHGDEPGGDQQPAAQRDPGDGDAGGEARQHRQAAAHGQAHGGETSDRARPVGRGVSGRRPAPTGAARRSGRRRSRPACARCDRPGRPGRRSRRTGRARRRGSSANPGTQPPRPPRGGHALTRHRGRGPLRVASASATQCGTRSRPQGEERNFPMIHRCVSLAATRKATPLCRCGHEPWRPLPPRRELRQVRWNSYTDLPSGMSELMNHAVTFGGFLLITARSGTSPTRARTGRPRSPPRELRSWGGCA
jgi:hypothetical protein